MNAIEFTPKQQISHNETGLYLIEASAGTGKTFTISNLFLRHIALGKAVSEILVVTFTIAATDELKGRIRNRLYEAYQNLKNNNHKDIFLFDLFNSLDSGNKDKLQKRLDLALRSMDESVIYTIHGFCQKALTEFAFLSGQSYQQELNNDKEQWLNPVILDWWRINVATQENKIKFNNYESLKWTNFSKFQGIYNRIAEKKITIKPDEVWEGYADKLQNVYSKLKKEWQKKNLAELLIESSCYEKRMTILKDANLLSAKIKLDKYFEEETINHLSEALDGFSKALLNSKLKKTCSESDLPNSFFFEWVDQLKKIYQKQKVVFLANSLRHAELYISQESQKLKKQQQIISFQDLLNNLYQALRSNQSKSLIKALQKKYPVAFIDEFQDTDPVQYGIFKKLYYQKHKTTLYMIGDPKQAIYSFRGSDIHTYIQAKQDLINKKGQLYTLNTNWRSTPEMINSVNSIFKQRGNDAFLYGDIIPFVQVKSPTERQKEDFKYLTIDNKKQSALNFWLTEHEDIKAQNKEDAYKLIDQNVSDKVVELLNLAQQGRAKLGNKQLKENDIAILVPTHRDAQRLQKKLQTKGVQSVVSSNSSVYKSEQAVQLLILLNSIIDYTNHQAQRQALSCSLINLDYQKIDDFINDEVKWEAWCKSLKILNQKWHKQGFMPMFMNMMSRLKLVEGIKNTTEQDRSLTNLMHLAELIQQASKKHSTIEEVRNWYSKQLDKTSNEETEIRLESDANLVKITTIHSSKGLEYGIVFLPYLWGLAIKKYDTPLYHDTNNELILEYRADKQKQAKVIEDYERLAEHLRLVYVALTRSVSCCYVSWGNISGADKSALAYLLHYDQSSDKLKKEQILNKRVKEFELVKKDIKELNKQVVVELKKLAYCKNLILAKNDKSKNEFVAKTFSGKIDRLWKINSYSKLTVMMEHSLRIDNTIEQSFDDIFDFPAGVQTGNYIHEILEKINFHQNIDEQVDSLNNKLLSKYAISEELSPTVKRWVNHITKTKFGKGGLSLQALNPKKQLAEMVFNFSVNKVDITKLNNLLQKYAYEGYKPIDAESFKGLVNGIIDLVFEYKGKYYLADYKSNLLGRTLVYYTPDNLKKEINNRRYDLQYLLYSVALERYCQERIDNYSYKTHFGGVYYLFLRAMREETGNQYGSFFIRPDETYFNQFKSLF